MAESEKIIEAKETRELAVEAHDTLPKRANLLVEYNVLVVRLRSGGISADNIEPFWQNVYNKAHGVPLEADTCTTVRIEDVSGRIVSEVHWPRPWFAIRK